MSACMVMLMPVLQNKTWKKNKSQVCTPGFGGKYLGNFRKCISQGSDIFHLIYTNTSNTEILCCTIFFTLQKQTGKSFVAFQFWMTGLKIFSHCPLVVGRRLCTFWLSLVMASNIFVLIECYLSVLTESWHNLREMHRGMVKFNWKLM